MLFIVNPKSGSAAGRIDIGALLDVELDKTAIAPTLVETRYPGHATELARQAVSSGVRVVCAVGGDGTVNEVARGLVHSDTALAILPRGSGNGLARHLNIPMNLTHAVGILNGLHRSTIDSCQINGHPFFCTAGIGFDAHVSSVFAASARRGLRTYLQLVVQEFLKFKPQQATLQLEKDRLEADCFVVAFANAAQYGNNAYIAPMADIRDGLVDVCLIRSLSVQKAIALGYGMITKRIATSADAQYFKTPVVTVHSQEPFKFHADGDFMGEDTAFTVSIFPLSLQVIVPAE
ncbi:MAG: diacylglycerol/lipid kinase family protein [Adhaeribacter sp.]